MTNKVKAPAPVVAEVAEVAEVHTPAKKLTRNEIRAGLFSNNNKPTGKVITVFGVEVEMRQPSLRAILASREVTDEATRVTDVFIKYTYVPGTNELVFDAADRDSILEWPFNDDLLRVQTTIAELTGIDLGDIEEEIQADPLDVTS